MRIDFEVELKPEYTQPKLASFAYAEQLCKIDVIDNCFYC